MQLKDELQKLSKNDTKPIKTIIFCDPGLDDLLMLIQILSSSDYQIVGIIPVNGNAKTFYTVNNTLNLCEMLGKINVPIYAGSDYNPNEADQDDKTAVYGQQGLGTITPLPVAKKIQLQNMTGIDFACKALSHERHLIISTASTTEPAKILQKLTPDALNNIIAISLMGGVINPTQEANWPIKGTELFVQTRQQQLTEANIGFDPPSSKIVFDICAKYKVPILLSPLDLTHSLLASENDVAIIREVGNPVSDLVTQVISNVPPHYQKRYMQGPDNKFRQPLHDVHASSCLMHPELYQGVWVTLDVKDNLGPNQSTIIDATKGNVFLLNMHYVFRQAYFQTFACDLKHYHYLNKISQSEMRSTLPIRGGLFSTGSQAAITPTAKPTDLNSLTPGGAII